MQARMTSTSNDTVNLPLEIDFHGAAIVREDGVEIPITADMVEKALRDAQGSVGHADDHFST